MSSCSSSFGRHSPRSSSGKKQQRTADDSSFDVSLVAVVARAPLIQQLENSANRPDQFQAVVELAANGVKCDLSEWADSGSFPCRLPTVVYFGC